MPRKSKILDSCLKNSLYSAWIVPGKVDTLACCKWCYKDVDVLNIGKSHEGKETYPSHSLRLLYKSLLTHHC